MLFCHNIAIQAVNHDLALISGVDHAVLAIVQSNVFAYLGIAIYYLLAYQGFVP